MGFHVVLAVSDLDDRGFRLMCAHERRSCKCDESSASGDPHEYWILLALWVRNHDCAGSVYQSGFTKRSGKLVRATDGPDLLRCCWEERGVGVDGAVVYCPVSDGDQYFGGSEQTELGYLSLLSSSLK